MYKGRRSFTDENEIRTLAGEAIAIAQIARDFGISRIIIYRALADIETEPDLD